MNRFLKFTFQVCLCSTLLALHAGSVSSQSQLGRRRSVFQDLVEADKSQRAPEISELGESSSSEEDASKVHFFLFNHKNEENKTGYELSVNDTAALRASPFIPEAPIKVLVHGFASSYQSGFPTDVKDAYLNQTENINLILVDWRELASIPLYDQAVLHTKLVGDLLAQLLELMIDNSYTTLEHIHIIGHSLGAHISGIAGDRVKVHYGGKQVARISGLDPAKPLVSLFNNARKLDKSDAVFVDIIHTSVLGIYNPIGSVDFYPNSGKLQPGCGVDPACSHSRAHELYAESVYHPYKFKSCKCHTDILGFPVFLQGSCTCDPANNSTIAYMGVAAKLPDSGVFWLSTAK